MQSHLYTPKMYFIFGGSSPPPGCFWHLPLLIKNVLILMQFSRFLFLWMLEGSRVAPGGDGRIINVLLLGRV